MLYFRWYTFSLTIFFKSLFAEMAEKHEEEMVTVIPLEVKNQRQSLDSDVITSKVAAAVPNFKPIS